MEMIILSPDGFPIHPEDSYKTFGETMCAMGKFVERYELQGYYSSMHYGKISLEELHQYCTIQLLDNFEDSLDSETE